MSKDDDHKINNSSEVINMPTTLNSVREYNLEKALNQGVKEMRLMQSGKLPKKTWKELKNELQKEKQ
ncbi:MAG TPA: hypothetical protein GXX58_10980 [Gelria sp.]|nr:hypothetical protein [Gelria sp.]